MTVYSGSRYATARISAIQGTDGVVRKFVHSRRVYNDNHIGSDSQAVTVVVGDELDSVAYGRWGAEEPWWFVADVNDIMFPLFDDTLVGPNQIHIGSSLQVPSRITMSILTK